MDISQEIMNKAATLVEALPYIQKFQDKVVIVKYGGSAMTDENLKMQVMQDVALLKLVGLKPIIVHGGGKDISKWISKVGKEPKFVNGLRVTDDETMEIAEMVLNKVNKSLVQLINNLGGKSVGISGKDGNLLKCVKKYSNGEDIGFVGEVVDVDTTVIKDLMDDNFIPVICPVGFDDHGQTYNVNADDAACAIAAAMHAEKLAYLTDVEGVYKDFEDKNSLIHTLSLDEAQEMIDSGILGGGMLPKLQNCIDAMKKGVNSVHILDGRVPHCLLLEIFTNKGIGTMIEKSIDKAFD
ncbi:N-acetylglutamate kinase [Oribacterium sp. KHPX15]|nr:acetylglutamate kinase [Oribacterium sp. NK2B42]SEA32446.1 N-acetylglutamate kinase [Oribacterium sp. KHPX15]